jgi:protoheme IX farnesyltransferase
LFPYAVGMSGVVYLAAAVVLNAIFLRYGWMIHKHYSDQVARKAFAWSIVYLSLLFAALLVDHYVKHYLPF